MDSHSLEYKNFNYLTLSNVTGPVAFGRRTQWVKCYQSSIIQRCANVTDLITFRGCKCYYFSIIWQTSEVSQILPIQCHLTVCICYQSSVIWRSVYVTRPVAFGGWVEWAICYHSSGIRLCEHAHYDLRQLYMRHICFYWTDFRPPTKSYMAMRANVSLSKVICWHQRHSWPRNNGNALRKALRA